MLYSRNERGSPVTSNCVGGRVSRALTGRSGEWEFEYRPSTRVWLPNSQFQSQSTKMRTFCTFEARRCSSRLEAEEVLHVMEQFGTMNYARKQLLEANLVAAYLLTGSAASLSEKGQHILKWLQSSKQEGVAMSTIRRMYIDAEAAVTLFFGATERALMRKINMHREAMKSAEGLPFKTAAHHGVPPTSKVSLCNHPFSFAPLSTVLDACASQIAKARPPGSDRHLLAEGDERPSNTDGFAPDTLPTQTQSEGCSPLSRARADLSAIAQPPDASAVPAPSLSLLRHAATNMAAPSPAVESEFLSWYTCSLAGWLAVQ